MSICQEIREIKRALTRCSIIYVGREANYMTHLYAKQASVDRRRYLWINYNQGFLSDTLRSDCIPSISLPNLYLIIKALRFLPVRQAFYRFTLPPNCILRSDCHVPVRFFLLLSWPNENDPAPPPQTHPVGQRRHHVDLGPVESPPSSDLWNGTDVSPNSSGIPISSRSCLGRLHLPLRGLGLPIRQSSAA